MESITDRTFRFAVDMVRFVRTIPFGEENGVIRRQLLKSGTSMGANVEEAFAGASRRDFTNKLAIAQKEARETNYWLRVLAAAGIECDRRQLPGLTQESKELLLIISKSVVTSKQRSATHAVTTVLALAVALAAGALAL